MTSSAVAHTIELQGCGPRVPCTPAVVTADISPSGEFVATVEQADADHDLRVRRRDGELVYEARDVIGGRWSPEGERLAILYDGESDTLLPEKPGRLVVWDALAGTAVEVADTVSRFAWSCGSDELLLQRPKARRLLSWRPGEALELVEVGGLGQAPSGDLSYVASGAVTIVIDGQRGTEARLGHPALANGEESSVAPVGWLDATRLAVSTQKWHNRYFVLDFATGELFEVPVQERKYWHSFVTEDGRLIITDQHGDWLDVTPTDDNLVSPERLKQVRKEP